MNLKQLRISEGKTQVEIAKAINITQYTYSNYETGYTEPNIETLIKLADYYGVSLDYLVGRKFKNELGYLTENEKQLLTNFRNLSEQNKVVLLAESKGMLAVQF